MTARACPQCGIAIAKSASAVNRAARIGAPIYCGQACFHASRRLFKDAATKRAEKSAYDRARRAALGEKLRSEKRAAYYASHSENLAKQAALRRRPGHQQAHNEYLARPEQRAKKRDYDSKLRASEYGEFCEAWRLLLELEKEIRSRATAYERRVANGYYTRNAQKRRRELWNSRKTSNSTLAT